VWAKANPNLGVSVRLDHIERECKRAQSDPAYENTFKRLHLNIRTEQAFRLIQMIHWDACDKPVEIPDGAAVTIGLDGASVQDMASAVVCYFDGDDYHLEPYYFCPEAQVVEMEARGDSLYRGWVTEGLLIATPGNSIDDRAIRKKLNELASQYDVREVPYDPYNLTTFATQVLEEDGIPMVEHRQGDISMNEPMKAMIRLMLNGNIRHGAHPILRWNASNLAAKENPSGNIRPDKAKSAGKIDGIVGAIMAIGRADKDSGDSFYETNRLETTDG
jgi:phage terminase large subunit-like protein